MIKNILKSSSKLLLLSSKVRKLYCYLQSGLNDIETILPGCRSAWNVKWGEKEVCPQCRVCLDNACQ